MPKRRPNRIVDSDSDSPEEEDPEVVRRRHVEATRKSMLAAGQIQERRHADRTSSNEADVRPNAAKSKRANVIRSSESSDNSEEAAPKVEAVTSTKVVVTSSQLAEALNTSNGRPKRKRSKANGESSDLEVTAKRPNLIRSSDNSEEAAPKVEAVTSTKVVVTSSQLAEALNTSNGRPKRKRSKANGESSDLEVTAKRPNLIRSSDNSEEAAPKVEAVTSRKEADVRPNAGKRKRQAKGVVVTSSQLAEALDNLKEAKRPKKGETIADIVKRQENSKDQSDPNCGDAYHEALTNGKPILKRGPRTKKPNVEKKKSYDKFCIKTGYDSAFARNSGKGWRKAEAAMSASNIAPATDEVMRDLHTTLNETVVRTSLWTVEAGLYIHFLLYRLLASGNETSINAEFNATADPDETYFVPHFMALNGRLGNPSLNAKYAKIRPFEGHDKSRLGNVIVFAARMFRTNFKNNVCMHTRRHVRHFLNQLFPGKQHKTARVETLNQMFHNGTNGNAAMLAKVKDVMECTDYHLLNDCWYTRVPCLWRLQRFNEANGLKNFTIIPQYKHGRKAIHIDRQTMVAIANSFLPRGSKHLNTPVDFEGTWSPYLNYRKFETGNRKFDFAITTDGASFVSLQMVREHPKKKTDAQWAELKRNKLARIRRKYEAGEFDKIIGIDEGQKLMVAADAAVFNAETQQYDDIRTTKYKARSFQYDSGQLYFKRKSQQIYTAVLRDVENDRKIFHLRSLNHNTDFGCRLHRDFVDQGLIDRRRARQVKYNEFLMNRQAAGTLTKRQQKTLERRTSSASDQNVRNRTELSKMSWNYVDYVKFELKHLQTVQRCMVDPVLAHHKFKRSIFIKKTATNIADQLVQTGYIVPNTKVAYTAADRKRKKSKQSRSAFKAAKSSTLVFLGNFRMSADSPMKGHPRSASSQFKTALKRRCEFLVIDEYNTTKCCSVCNKKLQIAKPPERFGQCMCVGNKRKVWNRDINAAINIRKLGLLHIQNQPRPIQFTNAAQLFGQPTDLRTNRPNHFVPVIDDGYSTDSD